MEEERTPGPGEARGERGVEPTEQGPEAPVTGSRPPVEASDERPVSAADLERVIRRASDLQFRAGSAETGSALDESEVLRIGEEVGLEPRYVRQALAEIHADSLIPALPGESPLAARLWGPGLVRVSRVVPGEDAAVQDELEAYLRDREVLRRVRSGPGRSLWEAAGGLVSTMRRAMDVGGHGYELAKARSVELVVRRLEPGFVLVTLTADLRNERGQLAVGWHLGALLAAAPAALVLLAAVGIDLLPLLGAGALGGGAVAGGSHATGVHFGRRRQRVELVLEGILDRLQQGERLSDRPSWKDRLLEATRP